MKNAFRRNEHPDMLRSRPHLGYVKGLWSALDFLPLAAVYLRRIGRQQDCGMKRQNIPKAAITIPRGRRYTALKVGNADIIIDPSQANRCRKYFGVT